MVQFNLRIQDIQDEKIKYIANNQQRSKNKQIEFILNQFIQDFEKVNGRITEKDLEEYKKTLENK